MQTQKINLYQHRDIGALINVTFTFVRQNIKPLMKAQFHINGPLLLLLLLSLGYGQYLLWSNLPLNESAVASLDMVNLGLSGVMNVLAMFVAIVFFVMVSVVPLAYMKLYQAAENPLENGIEPAAVWLETKRKLAGAFGGGILAYILIVIGVFLCVLPGIFLAISFSLFMVTLVLEQKSAIDAIKRSYDLVKTQWWFSLAFLFVISIILSVVMGVIYTPLYVIAFLSSIFSADINDPVAVQEAFQTTMLWYIVGMYGLMFVVSLLQVSISQTAAAFLYGTLVEDKEGVGLVNEIGQVLEKDKPDSSEV